MNISARSINESKRQQYRVTPLENGEGAGGQVMGKKKEVITNCDQLQNLEFPGHPTKSLCFPERMHAQGGQERLTAPRFILQPQPFQYIIGAWGLNTKETVSHGRGKHRRPL